MLKNYRIVAKVVSYEYLNVADVTLENAKRRAIQILEQEGQEVVTVEVQED